MASCQVPDFPAVTVALEHLKELDTQLKEEGMSFSPEASLHLGEITAAVTELEAYWRAAHECLEVETIENSKLRHQINNMREKISQEIMADVAAARASNSEEMEQLHKDLLAVSQQQVATVKREEALLHQNEALYPEREQVKAEHEELLAALNDQITFKYGLQMHLDQTQEQIEELKNCTVAIEQDKIGLQQSMALDRDAFTAKRDSLSGEVDLVEGKLKHQKQALRRSRKELDIVNDKKRETHDHLGELTLHMAKLESNLQRLTASRCQSKEQLEGEIQKHQELRQQRERLKKELCELKKVLSVDLQRLTEEIATVEDKIEEGGASRMLYQDSLAEISEIFKHQCDEESRVRAEHFRVSRQLEQSKLQLEECIATTIKHSKEIKEMDKLITELLEADTLNKRVFERAQEEMGSNMDTEKRSICHFEEEKSRLMALLEGVKRKQEEHVAKMTSDIGRTRRRYQKLRQEEAALLQRQPESMDADLLMSHVTQFDMEYRREETKRHQEIEEYTAEAEIITRSNKEKQREVEEKEGRLKEVETTWSKEQARHKRVQMLTRKLRRRRSNLELLIQGLKEKTSSLLQPKKQLKAELEKMRKSHMDMLDQQASELRAAETSIYENRVKMEHVSVENSRLHLCIRQMTEDVNRARKDRDKYKQEIHQFHQDRQALLESLEKAWREDVAVTQDCQRSDDVLQLAMKATRPHLDARRQQLEDVSSLLHQQMLDFSRRLGDETTTVQQRASADL